MGVAILKSGYSVDAIKSEAKEKYGEKYGFGNSLEGLNIRPIYFIYRATVSPLDNSRQRFLGEASAVSWEIGKFRKYFWFA